MRRVSLDQFTEIGDHDESTIGKPPQLLDLPGF
jgi:hypothetical protein